VTGTSVKTDDRYDLLSDDHFRVEWFSGTGKGGQHRNKKQNSCRVIHIPTGLCEMRQGRKRENNLREAKQALIITLSSTKKNEVISILSASKKEQVGSGMRGDKIRTYRFQDDRVIDHNTGRTAKLKQIMKGNLDVMWN